MKPRTGPSEGWRRMGERRRDVDIAADEVTFVVKVIVDGGVA